MACIPRVSRLRSAANPKQQQSSRTRTTRKRVSYREESSDALYSDSDATSDEHDATSSRPILSKSAKILRTNTSRKRKAPNPSCAGVKKTKTGHSARPTKQEEVSYESLHTAGKAMPWTTLPYQILVTIFDYASWPLVSDTFTPYPSISWLLHVGLLCRAFAEPALSVLYYSPPLTPPSRAHSLLDHLAAQDEQSTYNYRAKIKYLEVEAQNTLMHKYAGQDPIDLGELVRLTPQLRGMGIHLLSDNPRLRKAMMGRAATGRIAYQQSLFAALQEGQTMLREWTWNQALASQSHPLAGLKTVHTLPAFQTLQKIAFVNYQGSLARDSRREELLAEAVTLLPSLTGLSFKMSSIVNHRLMLRLPNNLQTLEIVECKSVKSSTLSAYLSTGGRNLRQLILDHNQSLNLSFLTTLGIDCPHLEVLKMDLRYYNTFLTVRDSDPKYDSLFGDQHIPRWPASIQRLELFHLRKWSIGQAEDFFSSLIQAARSLSQLRQLRIKASLEASGWRERVGFRDKWTKNLQFVFQRKFPPPDPCLRSIATYQAFKTHQSKPSRSQTRHKLPSKLSRVEVPHVNARACENDNGSPLIKAPSEDREESGSDAPLSKVRRSIRMQTRQNPNATLSSSIPNASRPKRRRRRRRGSDSLSSEDSALDDDGPSPSQRQDDLQSTEMLSYVQGMCDVVDILIDNLRPTEEQLNENDFLDEEISGDESWNGDDDGDAGGGYAW